MGMELMGARIGGIAGKEALEPGGQAGPGVQEKRGPGRPKNEEALQIVRVSQKGPPLQSKLGRYFSKNPSPEDFETVHVQAVKSTWKKTVGRDNAAAIQDAQTAYAEAAAAMGLPELMGKIAVDAAAKAKLAGHIGGRLGGRAPVL